MSTATTASRLDELLAPLGLRGFIDEFVGERPLLLRGRPENARGLISLDLVVAAVCAPEAATGRLLVGDASLSTATDVRRYLESGQPIVWNGVRGATPELDALTAELAAGFGASVWANVYSTGTAVKPFDLHFDCHDVLAVHVEGAKEWFVSKVRVNCPLDVPALAPTIRRALAERREEALREPLMTVVTEPGDVLYIPRGQFHDARTPSGRSLHVTLAIAPPTGIDVIEALARLALREALFREYLPHQLANGPRSTEAHLERLADRLAELARDPQLLAELDRLGSPGWNASHRQLRANTAGHREIAQAFPGRPADGVGARLLGQAEPSTRARARRKGATMRLRLLLFAMLVATLVAAPAASADGVTVSRFAVSGSFFNPCTNENVDLSGTVLTVIDTTPEDNHGLEGHSVAMALKGEGQTTGAQYVFVDTNTITDNMSENGALVETGVTYTRVVAPGPGNDLLFAIVFHETTNANGELVVVFNRFIPGACV